MMGGSRSSRTRGGMRWTRKPRLTSVVDADGEVVWSWRPDAGVKSRWIYPRGDGGKKAGHRGEHAISRKPLRREGRMSPLNLYARVRFLCALCTRDRGCSAHPVFPAPSASQGGEMMRKPRADHAARTRTRILSPHSTVMPAKAGIQ